MLKNCSLIITTYNWPIALALVLKSVKNQTVMPTEVIIADDGSTNETKYLIEKQKKIFPVPIIHSWHEDRGFRAAMSRNRAIALANSPYIVIIDGDIILHREFIRDHLEFARCRTFIQGRRAKISDNYTPITINLENINFNIFNKELKSKRYAIRNNILSNIFSGEKKFSKLKMLQTCNMSFFREDCIKINGFNEDFIGWGREDAEFGARLLNSGVSRRDLKFKAVGYHLHHEGNSRFNLKHNNHILSETVKSRSVWCENGINKYLM